MQSVQTAQDTSFSETDKQIKNFALLSADETFSILETHRNGFFSYWQEYQAECAAEALQALLPHQVTVRREGEEKLISAEIVVRGDILILSEGETIPADARLFSAEELKLDLSSLTGESRPIPRSTIAHLDGNKLLAFFPNLVFAGTSVAHGRGEAVVFAIGANTEFGRIAELTQEQTKELSPLEK